MKQEHKNKVSDEVILEKYNEGKTLHKTAAELKMSVVTVWRRAKKLNINWSNIKRPSNAKIPLVDILNGKHPEYQTFKLKVRLINEGFKENICNICGITEWNNKPINMQLDHIDGVSSNHVLSNLQLICPNCHSQTDTWCGKNK